MATAVGSSIALTGDARIDGLLQGGAWQFSGPALLTYSFSANTEPGDPVWSSYPALAAAFSAAATAWSNVANVAFAELGSGSVITQSPADIAVALENEPQVPLIALSVFPDPQFVDASFLPLIEETRGSYLNPEGDVLLNIGFSQLTDLLQPGGWGLWVLVHELGHALGLKHTADDGANGRPTFAELGIAAQDAVQHTVMSSNGAQIAVHGNPATPMPLDILAIQHIYGANLAYHTGDDVYVLANDGVMRTVWDAGGIDTFDASALFFETTIDLREGAFSSHGTIVGTMTAVAYDTVIENAIGGAGSDVIIGNAAANALSGGPGFGNDTLDGGTGADTLRGGFGNDTYTIDNVGDVLVEEAGAGTDMAHSAVTYALPSNVEDLLLTGTVAINGTGNALSNHISGNAAANVLDGGAEFDFLAGGAGDDTYIVETVRPAHSLALEGEAGNYILNGQSMLLTTQTGVFDTREAFDITNDGEVDFLRIYFWGEEAWHLDFSTSNLGVNLAPGTYLNARDANPLYPGHPGLDVGGDGRGSNLVFGSFVINAVEFSYAGPSPELLRFSATFEQRSESISSPALRGSIDFDLASAVVEPITELPNEGDDSVLTSVAMTLPDHVERLTLVEGGGVIDGTGNMLANVLTGNAAANQLIGLGGNDTLLGGLGNDTLKGSAGADRLAGGAGDDTYVVVGDDVVIELDGEGTDTVLSAVSYTLGSGVERLTLAGAEAISGTGNGLANLLTGNAAANKLSGAGGNDTLRGGLGNDMLNGGAGADRLEGGAGDDGYFVGADDVVIEIDGEGTDTVVSSLSYTLGTGVERLTLTGAEAISGTGNAAANLLLGNAAANVLDGGLGADIMKGGAGDDTYLVDASSDRVVELAASGTDSVQASASFALAANVENLTLTGTALINGTGNAASNLISGNDARNALAGLGGADTLSGGAGNDLLKGGTGTDVLTGGAGADNFFFMEAPGTANSDLITDFASGADRLALDDAFFSGLGALGRFALADARFYAAADATAGHDADDRIVYDSSTGALYYDADGSGAGVALLFATLQDHPTLGASDITVI